MPYQTPISPTVSLPRLPNGECPSTLDELNTFLFRNLRFVLTSDLNPGFFTVSESVPEVGQRGSPWLRKAGDAFDGIYTWSGENRGWIRPNPWPPGYRMLIECTEEELKTVDGGDINILSPASGPMWEIDHDFDGRTPIGVSTDYPAWETGGAGVEVVEVGMLPKHQHYIEGKGMRIGPGRTLESLSTQWFTGEYVPAGNPNPVPNTADKDLDVSIGNELGVDDDLQGGVNNAVNIVHPVRSVFVCKRTLRRFYKVTE